MLKVMTITDTKDKPMPPPTDDELDRAVDALFEESDCTRCHGTGVEPTAPEGTGWRPVLRELVHAGRRRQAYTGSRRAADAMTFNQAVADTYDLWWGEARPLGIPQVLAARANGLTRAHFYNLVNGKVGEIAAFSKLYANAPHQH